MKPIVWAVLVLSLPLCAQVSVLTSRNDNMRDGQNLQETILTPANVNVTQFGKLFHQDLDGYVYAQPLYVPNVSIPGMGTHNVVYVVTEHDSVYAFDADNNVGLNASPLWHRSFINPGMGITTVSSNDVNCTDLVPEIGITSTPVIDPAAKTLFVHVRTKENGQFFQRLHALDMTTGKERSNSPVVIQASVPGNGVGSVNGVITFDPLIQAQRPGLLLSNGALIIGWASHCDNGNYHGWVMAYDPVSLKQIAVANTTPNGARGGIWQSGTGISSDGNYIYFATGNGSFDGPKNGLDFGDSVLRVPFSTTHATAFQYFTPYDQGTFNAEDADVGAGGVLLLPDQAPPHTHLLVEVGKSGSIYLIDRDHFGGYNSHDNHQIVQDMEDAIGGLWATPAWWNNNIYFGGSHDYLRQYTFDPATELLSDSAVAVSGTYFGFPGPTPSISANGTTDAIVWALQTDKYGSGYSVLHAYDANNIATELYNTAQNPSRDTAGGAVKFTVPTIANGKVYVPGVGNLSVYGLLSGK